MRMHVDNVAVLFSFFKWQINHLGEHQVKCSRKKLHLKRSKYSVVWKEINKSFSFYFYLNHKEEACEREFLQSFFSADKHLRLKSSLSTHLLLKEHLRWLRRRTCLLRLSVGLLCIAREKPLYVSCSLFDLLEFVHKRLGPLRIKTGKYSTLVI